MNHKPQLKEHNEHYKLLREKEDRMEMEKEKLIEELEEKSHKEKQQLPLEKFEEKEKYFDQKQEKIKIYNLEHESQF